MQGQLYEKHLQDQRRVDIWLWLELSCRHGVSFPPGSLRNGNVRKGIVNLTSELRVNSLLQQEAGARLLPQEKLNWIVEDDRQVRWLHSYISTRWNWGTYRFPPELLGRDLIIAFLDFRDDGLSAKAEFVDEMQKAWNEHLKSDRLFKWFKDEENSRCVFAWNWLVQKKGEAMRGRSAFASHQGLVMLYDELGVGSAQMRLDILDIQKNWHQQKRREEKRLAGEKQINLEISAKAIIELDKLTKKYGLSRSKVVETLIQNELKNRTFQR